MVFPVLVYAGACAGGAVSGGCGAVIGNFILTTFGKKEDPGTAKVCAVGCATGAVTGLCCAGLADLDPALNFIDTHAGSLHWADQLSVGARVEGSCGCPMGMAAACLLDESRKGEATKEAAPAPEEAGD
eukprot:TRINITY_DN33190_c0_g1_i1.p2 TRINITY_DN33190_c0_g1~~TRINITY_DN33190_c0_g1_i1.p2  ORF type:complete len:146 (+),score=47.06 TRINITY_DN33190_c0_g1_i1:53-439(+)